MSEKMFGKRSSSRSSLRTRSSKKSFRKAVSQSGVQDRKSILKDLFNKDLLRGRQTLKKEYKKSSKVFYGFLLPSVEFEYQGKKYSSPSAAAKVATKREQNGWTFWSIKDKKSNKWITLDEFTQSKASGFKAKIKPLRHRKFLKEREKKDDKTSAQLNFFNRETLPLQVKYKSKIYRASLLSCGKKVQYEDEIYSSPSAVARLITGSSCNGWIFWSAQESPGKWVKLKHLRKLDKAS